MPRRGLARRAPANARGRLRALVAQQSRSAMEWRSERATYHPSYLHRQLRQPTRAVAVSLGTASHAIHQRQPEVSDRRFLRKDDVTAGIEGAAPFARQQDRQVAVIVADAVAIAVAEED